jgi:hypothetical protein
MTFSVTLFRALKFEYQKPLYRKPPMILKTLPKLLYNKYVFLDIFPDSYEGEGRRIKRQRKKERRRVRRRREKERRKKGREKRERRRKKKQDMVYDIQERFWEECRIDKLKF